ncbi:MAG: hypothetical protein GF330_13985 [Candidatus Eisenbacteria bacterium]|nr:hypothetical protein [Candidatus Eisenbacteria bacterium]
MIPKELDESEIIARAHCAVCGQVALIFWWGDFWGDEGLVIRGIVHERLAPPGTEKQILEQLEKGSIGGVHEIIKPFWKADVGLDAYCPKCDRVYCAEHWKLEDIWEDGWWYDCTYGTCPEGHRRMVDD